MQRHGHPLVENLVWPLFALAVSALLLTAGFAWQTTRGAGTGAALAAPVTIAGHQLQAVVGGARARGEALAVTAYQPITGEHIAVAVWRGRLQAEELALLAYRIEGDAPGTALSLIWRRADAPEVFHSADLGAVGPTRRWLSLDRHPDWAGTVIEVGVHAAATDAGAPLSIAYLDFQPRSARTALASLWSDWTTLRGWTARSINFLYGSTDRDALSPVLAAAAWCALAVALLLCRGLVAGRLPRVALATTVLLPWLAVDLLWQHELSGQLNITRQQFGGKSMHEKHLADVDAAIFRHATRLRDEVLPATTTRLVLLHDSSRHNFNRLKTQYYLLPHNVYNFGRTPPATGMEHVDYVLLLGELPGLRYNDDTATLEWEDWQRQSLAVELVDTDPLGRLYRVVATDIDTERDR